MAGKRTQQNHHALPKYVYIRRGWYVYREYLGQGKLGKDIKLCPADSPVSELWQRYESLTNATVENKEKSYTKKIKALELKFNQEKKKLEDELNKEILNIKLLQSKSNEISNRINEKQQFSIENMNYESIPKAMIEAEAIINIPQAAGIYFIWSGDAIVYVGQSINLKNRLNLESHYNIMSGDTISYILIDRSDLQFAESFYIGLLRPVRNFGQKAHHRRYKKPCEL